MLSMKKIFIVLLFSTIVSLAWAVDKQTYLDPSVLPEGFVCYMERYDVCEPHGSNGTISNMRNVNHTQKDIKLTWDPTYVNASGSYGRLFIENFFTNDSLRSVCNLEFANDANTNRNFKWSDDGKQLMFSFKSVEIGPNIGVYGWTTYKTAYIASAKSGSSQYWAYDRRTGIFNNSAAYGYSGGQEVNFTYDLETKTITSSSVWGIFMCTGSGSSPGTSRVFHFYTSCTFHCVCTDLVDIVNDEDISVGDDVTVADDLLGVKVVDEYDNGSLVRQVLFAKDMNKYASPDVKPEGTIDYMMSSGVFSQTYDQSNWVTLTFDNLDETGQQSVMGLEGYVIKGGTVKGTLTDKTNPSIALSEAPVVGQQQSYSANIYVLPSFNDAYAAEGSRYFFVRPKPQEWCLVQWAVFDAATNAFYVPAHTENANGFDLSGGVTWNNKYLPAGNEAVDQTVYIFPAIVNVMAQPAALEGGPRRETANPKVDALSTRYQVMPLELSPNSVVTAVNDVKSNKALLQTTYYNMVGVSSATPFKGVNVVVNRYADGTTSVTKVIR